jgi:hypothetical protein
MDVLLHILSVREYKTYPKRKNIYIYADAGTPTNVDPFRTELLSRINWLGYARYMYKEVFASTISESTANQPNACENY